MRNPPITGLTAPFQIATCRQNTTVVRDWNIDIAGVTILPGLITEISQTKIDLYMIQAMNKIMDYEIHFTLTNGLSQGNTILVIFPPSFNIESNANYFMYYIKYGLEDITEIDPVGMQAVTGGVNNYLYISNFQAFPDYQQIGIVVRARNPNSANATTPLKIQSYLDWQVLATGLID